MVTGRWRGYNALLHLPPPLFNDVFFFKEKIFTVYVWKLTCRSQFCLYTMWVLGNELRSPGLVSSAFTH